MTLASFVVDAVRPVTFRGKARVLDPLVPHSGEIEASIYGYDVSLDLSDHIQRHVYMGAYERELTAVFRDWLHRGQTVLDVGANCGYFTLLAARCVGRTGRVIAVEPSPWVANRLERTIKRNHLSHVRLERVALGATTGTLPLVEPLPGNHTPSLLTTATDRVTHQVSVARLDDCLPGWLFHVGRVDVMKVDIEGYESFLIQGGETVLRAGMVKRLAIEACGKWLARAGSSPQMLRHQLESLGFSMMAILDEGSANETFLMEHAKR